MDPKNQRLSSTCWYIEAICLGITIGFSEVLLAIYYGSREMDSVMLAVFITVPAAIGAMTQALATRRSSFFLNARRLALFAITVQVTGLLIMAQSLYISDDDHIRMFIGQCLYWMGGMTASSPTQEILAQEVSADRHNRFFSQRAMVMTILTLICNFTSAKILTSGLTSLLMSKLLFTAAIARGLSLVLVMLCSRSPGNPLSSQQPLPEDTALISIIKLSLLMMLFRASVNISSPFFTTYMLREIHLSFTIFSLLTAIPLITKTLCLTNWARLLDDNRRFEGLAIATVAIGAVPIMWAFWSSPEWLSILQVISGLSWAGFDLISILLVQNMYPRSITQKLGFYMALSSFGSVMGGVLGGLILRYTGDYHVLFAFSGGLRLLTGFAFLWYLRRHHFFRFHDLKIKTGIATIITVRPTIEAAVKILPVHSRRSGKTKTAA